MLYEPRRVRVIVIEAIKVGYMLCLTNGRGKKYKGV